MIARSMFGECCGRISRSTSRLQCPGALKLLARVRSLSRRRRVKVQIESKFRECLQRYSKQKAILLDPIIVAYDATEGRHPAREVPVNGIALLLERVCCGFILLLGSDAPVIVDSIISTDNKQAAVHKERIVIQIAMPDVQLQIG